MDSQTTDAPRPDAPSGGGSVPKPPPRAANWRGIALSLAINAILPLIIYRVLKRYAHVSEFTALVATGIPSLADAVVGVARRRRVDFMAGFTLFSIAVSLVLIALGGSPRLYLVRESLFTAAYGLAMLISLPLPKPLGFYTGRFFVAGNDPAREAWFDAAWAQAWFRRMIRVQTVIWGVGTTLEAAVRIFLALTLPVSAFLVISPLVFYGYLGLTFLVSGLYTRQWKKRRESEEAAQTS